MKSKVFAVLLIVLGVAATLGGLYGQIFLAEDEGHHDDREPTFALESQVGADEIVVEQVAPNSLSIGVERAGQPIEFDRVHDGFLHIFVASVDRTFFTHDGFLDDTDLDDDAIDRTAQGVDAPAGPMRIVTQLSPAGGPDLLELGTTVEVEGDAFEPQNISDTDEWTNDALTVTRQGFDFVLSEPWNGDDVYDGPALLTLFRAEDLAFTHAHAELVGDDRFSFATDLPGLGDYLAALEFEQSGELVTALFRFTL